MTAQMHDENSSLAKTALLSSGTTVTQLFVCPCLVQFRVKSLGKLCIDTR